MQTLRQAAKQNKTNAYFPALFVAVPLEFFDAHKQSKFCSDLQARFIQLIGRHTWSVASVYRRQKPLEWTAKPWTAAHVARELGTDIDSAQWMVANAVKRGLVTRRRVAGQQGFCYKTHPDMWAAAKPWEPPKRIEEVDTPPAEVVEIPAAVVAPTGEPGRPVTVKPGRTASVKISVERVEKVTYSSEGLAPFSAVAAFADGVLSLRFGRAEPGKNKGEEKAYPLRNGLRSSLLADFLKVVSYSPLTDELISSIYNKIGPEPSDDFCIRFFENKLAEKYGKYSIWPGLFARFAEDCRRKWEQQKTRHGDAKPASVVAVDPAQVDPETLVFALEDLELNPDDPAAKSYVKAASPEQLAAARAKMRPAKKRPAPVRN